MIKEKFLEEHPFLESGNLLRCKPDDHHFSKASIPPSPSNHSFPQIILVLVRHGIESIPSPRPVATTFAFPSFFFFFYDRSPHILLSANGPDDDLHVPWMAPWCGAESCWASCSAYRPPYSGAQTEQENYSFMKNRICRPLVSGYSLLMSKVKP